MSEQVTRRPATDEDRAFLYALYADTRADELAQVPWSEVQKTQFLRMQFQAQDRHYRAQYPTSTHEIVLLDGEPIGRLWMDVGERDLHVVDLAIHSRAQRRGIGTGIVHELQQRATELGLPMRLCVEHNNPSARTMYERLGFRQIDDLGMHALLEWQPSDAHANDNE